MQTQLIRRLPWLLALLLIGALHGGALAGKKVVAKKPSTRSGTVEVKKRAQALGLKVKRATRVKGSNGKLVVTEGVDAGGNPEVNIFLRAGKAIQHLGKVQGPAGSKVGDGTRMRGKLPAVTRSGNVRIHRETGHGTVDNYVLDTVELADDVTPTHSLRADPASVPVPTRASIADGVLTEIGSTPGDSGANIRGRVTGRKKRAAARSRTPGSTPAPQPLRGPSSSAP